MVCRQVVGVEVVLVQEVVTPGEMADMARIQTE